MLNFFTFYRVKALQLSEQYKQYAFYADHKGQEEVKVQQTLPKCPFD
ncbi:hypothetical protein NST12_04320 [Bacillus sp. FSL W8-1127]|nr:hypothetical protein BSM4216_1018 [Bacillus smithii]